jgi:terminase small subunit / prophage DNA-packing protein
LATQAEVAAHLVLTQAEVSKLIATRVLPKPEKRGSLDIDACREAYIRHIRAIAARWKAAPADDGEDTPLDLVTERARLASEQADGHSIKNALLRRDVLLKSNVVAAVQNVLIRFRQKMLALPSKAAPLIIGMTSLPDVVEKLTVLVNEALEELAALQFIPETVGGADGPGDDGGGEDSQAAPETND